MSKHMLVKKHRNIDCELICIAVKPKIMRKWKSCGKSFRHESCSAVALTKKINRSGRLHSKIHHWDCCRFTLIRRKKAFTSVDASFNNFIIIVSVIFIAQVAVQWMITEKSFKLPINPTVSFYPCPVLHADGGMNFLARRIWLILIVSSKVVFFHDFLNKHVWITLELIQPHYFYMTWKFLHYLAHQNQFTFSQLKNICEVSCIIFGAIRIQCQVCPWQPVVFLVCKILSTTHLRALQPNHCVCPATRRSHNHDP
mmetsp:Transcript_2042/g.4385  ORF Transcript_2042/g.4385 Transcript_2042/m.4385 type:complete len:255 (+) Transcript_2042:815-1579(+)